MDSLSKAPKKSIKTIIAGLGVPERLAHLLPDLAGILADSTGAHLTAAGRTRLIGLLTECPLVVSALGDLSIAMVTRGGVALRGSEHKDDGIKTGTRAFLCRGGARHRWRHRGF